MPGRHLCRCRVLPTPPKAWRSDLWLLTRPDLRHVPRIKQLFEAVVEGMRGQVELFEGRAGRGHEVNGAA